MSLFINRKCQDFGDLLGTTGDCATASNCIRGVFAGGGTTQLNKCYTICEYPQWEMHLILEI